MSGQNRYYSSTAKQATVTDNPLLAASTTVNVSATTGFPTSYPYTLIIERDTNNEEVVTVTAATGLALTITRGEDGTSAAQHNQGATIEHGVSARDFTEPQVHMKDNSIHYPRMGLFTGSFDPAICSDVFTLTDGHIQYFKFRAQENAVCGGIILDITTAGLASSDLEVGLYADSLGPATLLGSQTFNNANATTLVSPAGVYYLQFSANVNIVAGDLYWVAIRSKAGSGAATLLGKANLKPEVFNQALWVGGVRAKEGTGTALASNPVTSSFTDTSGVALWLGFETVGNIDFG